MKHLENIAGILFALLIGVVVYLIATLAATAAQGAPLATPRMASGTNAVKMTRTAVIVPPPRHQAILVWHSDYEGLTNVETVIDSTTGLVLPNWKEKFHGPTNRYEIEMTNRLEFFRAYNRLTGQKTN